MVAQITTITSKDILVKLEHVSLALLPLLLLQRETARGYSSSYREGNGRRPSLDLSRCLRGRFF